MIPGLLLYVIAAGFADTGPLKVVIVGDSLTEGLGVAKEEAYPSLLAEKFRADGHPVEIVNMGTSGATSASGPSRVKFALKMKPTPTHLVIALGANDALRGLNPDGTKKNLLEAVTLAQSAGLKVYLAGMRMPYNFPKDQRSRFDAVFAEAAL